MLARRHVSEALGNPKTSCKLMLEVAAVLLATPLIEYRRRTASVHHAVAFARERARSRPVRASEARQQLRRAIAFVDARFPGGGNCVRRSLLEIALDRGAAGEKMFAGFKAGGKPHSGHAWLESHAVSERYDAIVTV
jgi:hypothetical protein